MVGATLCLSTNSQFGVSNEEQIRLFKKAGFHGFFTMWDTQVARYKELAHEWTDRSFPVHPPILCIEPPVYPTW